MKSKTLLMDESPSHFLDQWLIKERLLVVSLRHEDEKVRLETLNNACKYFKVIRNLKILDQEETEGRLNPLLKILEKYKKNIQKLTKMRFQIL